MVGHAARGRVADSYDDASPSRQSTRQQCLPDGFIVEVDPSVRSLNNGAVLLGGCPPRVLRLSPRARLRLSRWRLEVRDVTSARLARILLDAGVAHPRPADAPPRAEVTAVLPVRDNLSGVRRLLVALQQLPVVVVDDGSTVPIEATDLTDLHGDVSVLRHRVSQGPAAARNTGLAACRTDFVAFLDSDVVPHSGWLEHLLSHFSDPAVALVAPRVVALFPSDNVLARYEAVRSSLDLGVREAPVTPRGAVSYVPSAAIVCRRAAIEALGGFDATLRSGEDVDLCWRLVDGGFRLRYEPAALVAHEHRTRTGAWIRRRFFYGLSAVPLSERHANKVPALSVTWSVVFWLLMASRSASGTLGALAAAIVVSRRVAASLDGVEFRCRHTAVITVESLAAAALQLAVAVCNQYWPLAVLGAVLSRRCRTIVLIAAVLDGAVDWRSRRDRARSPADRLDLLRYLGFRRLDDLAYGAGVWAGIVRDRNVGPLTPQFRK